MKHCEVCGAVHSDGQIVGHVSDDAYLNKALDEQLCPKHQALRDEGLIALVEIDDARTNMAALGSNNPQFDNEEVYFTGRYAWVGREFLELWKCPVPNNGYLGYVTPMSFERFKQAAGIFRPPTL